MGELRAILEEDGQEKLTEEISVLSGGSTCLGFTEILG